MEAIPSTRKFLNALTSDGRASSRKLFLIPDPDGSPWFVAIRTGKRSKRAYVVYVGCSICADDVLEEISIPGIDRGRVHRLVESLINELGRFQFDNVVEIEESTAERVKLRLVAPRTKPDPGPKLPG